MSDTINSSCRVVILAGGFGTRVRHILPGVPKPMALVCGLPFVEWVVRYYAKLGLIDFVLSTGYLSKVIEDHFVRQPVPGVKVEFCAEIQPLGTAGGFLNCTATGWPPCTWLVVNGDSMLCSDPRPLLEAIQGTKWDAAIMGVLVEDAARYGTLEIASDSRLVAFHEKKPGRGVINAGVYAFSHPSVAKMPANRPLSFETDVFPALVQSGRICARTVSAPFLDIGTPETLAVAETFISTQKPSFLL